MKLYLENGIAFFKDMGYIPGAPLKIELEIPGIDYTKFMVSVKINDLPSRTCKKSFEIKHIQLEEMDVLSIKVIVKHRTTGIKQVFNMDPVPIKKAFAIGGDLKDMYPVTYLAMYHEVLDLKRLMKLLRKAVVEIGKKGEII